MNPLLLCSLILAGRVGIDAVSIAATKSQIEIWARTNGYKLAACKPRRLQVFIIPFFLGFDVVVETPTDEPKTAKITFYRSLYLSNMNVEWQQPTDLNFGRY